MCPFSDGTCVKPEGTGSPMAQYDVVELADVARLMPAMVSPQVQYVCMPVIPADDRMAPEAIDVTNLQSAVGFPVDVGAEEFVILLPVPVAYTLPDPETPVGRDPVGAVTCPIEPEEL